MHPRVAEARARYPYTLDLQFTDGSEGTVDMASWIRGRGGVFAALHDPEYFAGVSVDHEAGTVVWKNGADVDPDVLFQAAQANVRTGEGADHLIS
jgi:hypothetical protein